jgi:hypothetical protein
MGTLPGRRFQVQMVEAAYRSDWQDIPVRLVGALATRCFCTRSCSCVKECSGVNRAKSDSHHPSKCQPKPIHQGPRTGELNACRIPIGPRSHQPTDVDMWDRFDSLSHSFTYKKGDAGRSLPFCCSFHQRRGKDTSPLTTG